MALLITKCLSIIVENGVLESSLVSGPGVTVASSSFVGNLGSIRSFREGPFGIGIGVIISSGYAEDAVPGGFANNDVGTGGSAFCGDVTSFDAAVWTVQVDVQDGYNGVLVEFIAASAENDREPDTIAIWLDGVQYALGSSGQQIDARSSYFQGPVVISQPNNDLQFNEASPPLLLGIPAATGPHNLVFAACDANDPYLDTGLLFKIQGCKECDEELKINCVTSTVTVAAGVATSTTETIKAYSTFSGTFLVTVQEAPDTSTTEADTTTATGEPTIDTATTTAESTPTSDTTADTSTEDTTEVTSGSQISTDTTFVESSSTTDVAADGTTTSGATSYTTTADTTETTMHTSEEPAATYDTSIGTTTEDTTKAASSADSQTSTDAGTIASTTSDITTEVTTDPITISSSTFNATPSDVTETSTVAESDETISTNGSTDVVSTDKDTTSISDSQQTRSSITIEPSFISETTAATDAEGPTSIERTSAITSEATPAVDSTSTLKDTANQPSTGITLRPSSSNVDSPSSTPSNAAFNLPFIGEYAYFGCLGSTAEYPTFTDVSNDDGDMTTEKCVSLAAGSKYIGLYRGSCFAADSLAGSMLVLDASCNLRCPGGSGLFCGGTTSGTRRRRDISSNLLLTLYAAEDDSSSLAAGASTTAAAGELATGVTTEDSGTSSAAEPISSPVDLLRPTASDTETTKARLPISFPTAGPSFMPTMRWTKGFNITKTAAAPASATAVTTVMYTTVDRDDPNQLITAEIAVTMGYTPCNCADQILPAIDMTTVMVPCNSCGPRGESNIWLTVPAAACQSDGPSRRPDIKVDPHGMGPKYMTHANPALKQQPSAESNNNNKSPDDYQDADDYWAHRQDPQQSTHPYKEQVKSSEASRYAK
ncbi:unnamed protein product [Fusarium venenatum]|uniref:WSC domain-containing protein n=1 Tax=Fusarium venenatum TaxID=56646 RepID=A0A2L2TKW8_9HYPO|nr:uncharacterized protein FVRRES_13778 [Fusarium venenatum]CEI41863.1 unnamed protein product [Fusarium venenatum]